VRNPDISADYLGTSPIQILNIHHLGHPHDVSKLRVQLKAQNVLDLRKKKLIVGNYQLGPDKIYAIFDPVHVSSLTFQHTTTLNISLEDIKLCQSTGVLLKRDKKESLILLLKNKLITEFLDEFYSNTSEHDINQWTTQIVDYYNNHISSNRYLNFQRFPTYIANAENYEHLRSQFKVNFVHINNFSFEIGFKNELSLIVDDKLFQYLTYQHHHRLILNELNFGATFINELKQILQTNPNPLFQVNYDQIILDYNAELYYQSVSEFTSNQYMSCATNSDINHYIHSRFSSITFNFNEINKIRFKERLLAGKSNEFESYYFDSNDTTINDIVYYSTSYSEFLSKNFNSSNNILDLFIAVYEIDENVECKRFWSAFKRAIKSAQFDYFNGRFSTFPLPDFQKEFIVRTLNTFLECKNSQYLVFQKKDVVQFKLEKHFAFIYFLKFFKYFEDSYTLNFEIDISFVDNESLSGYCFFGANYSIGIFPLIFPEVFINKADNYFFCYNGNSYYITYFKEVVNLQSIYP